ncbi:imidazolonepropionase [Temperatibacter marinus]|uniref:Imidazolonepropionase n=1 Tax=Temperatibacter marinus TaxID=1456591 RepID=A0AA52EFB0_9PROT|nr:imidazolonepropionase [Temperatibacter marinus]WND01780.1 imidazolonepropionase [Temperatibacter marinus]
MWDKLIKNIHISSMAGSNDSATGNIKNAALGIKDGDIVYIGPESNLPKKPLDQLSNCIIDGEEGWALPGFIDCHTHLVYAGNRSGEFKARLDGASYEDIAKAGGGILATVKATRAASEEELIEQSLPRLQALIQSGVTTIEIKSGYGLTLEDEIKMLKAAIQLEATTGITVTTTLLAAHSIPPEYKDRADAYIDHICAEIIPAALEAECVDAVDAFCEGIAFSPEQVKRVFAYAKAEGLDVKLHADQLSDLGGGALAADYNALSADHIEYASLESIKAMAEKNTVATLLPGAFYNLKETQTPPVKHLREYGVPIALATDCNPGSSPVMNIQLMLHMGCTLFGLTVDEALLGITKNAALALGMDETHGSLEVGKVADINLFKITDPADLVYNIGGIEPQMTFKDGIQL